MFNFETNDRLQSVMYNNNNNNIYRLVFIININKLKDQYLFIRQELIIQKLK